jgi:hypothetical protein
MAMQFFFNLMLTYVILVSGSCYIFWDPGLSLRMQMALILMIGSLWGSVLTFGVAAIVLSLLWGGFKDEKNTPFR